MIPLPCVTQKQRFLNHAHQIVACELTTPEVGDLLTRMITPFETFTGDGAYDGEYRFYKQF